MNAEAAERVAEIVEQTLELPTVERQKYVTAACGEDVDLRREVESLLALEHRARDFIEQPALAAAPEFIAGPGSTLKPGENLDDYKIISLIGEGGMSEVYLADDMKLRRKVAIKLLKFGLGTASFIRHFQQEEWILAGLVHPNIAQLYGGALTAKGLPYFVMEYVDGVRLDDYCRERQLPIIQQLKLFRKIAAAVSACSRILSNGLPRGRINERKIRRVHRCLISRRSTCTENLPIRAKWTKQPIETKFLEIILINFNKLRFDLDLLRLGNIRLID